MDLEERKAFDRLKEKALWFGKAFLASKGGTKWAEATGLSGQYYVPWFDFYWGIIIEDLEYLCNKLLRHKPEGYDRQALSEEISRIMQEINSLDFPPAQPKSPELIKQWERITVTPHFLKTRKKELNTLYDYDIVHNAPWNEPGSNILFVIISADNQFYKSHLLAIYTELAEKLQVIPKQSKSTPEAQTSESAPESESRRMEKEIERLRNEIDALKKQRSVRPEEDQPEEDQLGQNLMYRMTLLHRLGFLEKKLWPENVTQDQISTVLAAVLSSPQSPAKTATVKRYLKGLVNQDYDGMKIERKYGPRVEEFLEKAFSDRS